MQATLHGISRCFQVIWSSWYILNRRNKFAIFFSSQKFFWSVKMKAQIAIILIILSCCNCGKIKRIKECSVSFFTHNFNTCPGDAKLFFFKFRNPCLILIVSTICCLEWIRRKRIHQIRRIHHQIIVSVFFYWFIW